MALLRFEVKNQLIKRTDNFKVVADSQNYLYAQFDFLTDDWVGTKTAIFKKDNSSQSFGMVLDENNTCLVPHELLVGGTGRYLFVSVFCGSRVTANVEKVFIEKSGYSEEFGQSIEPTPTAYQQLVSVVDNFKADVTDEVDEFEDYVNDRLQHIDGGTFEDWRF